MRHREAVQEVDAGRAPNRAARVNAARRWAVLLALYTTATAVMVSPIANFGALPTASYEGDARLIIWTLAWDNHALLTGQRIFESNTFYPAARSLAFNEHLFGLSLFTLPLYAVTKNPVLSYNVVWILSFVLNGLAAHALIRRHTDDDLSATAGSLVYTFSFYKMLHGHGHLHLVWTWLIPLSVLLLERWVERRTWPRALAWGTAVLLQTLTSWYLAVMVILVQAIAVATLLPRLRREGGLKQLSQLAAVGVLAGAAVWPFATPYRTLERATPREAARHSADLTAYLMPPQDTWLGQQWEARVGPGPRWVWEERTLSIGWVALALAALGVWRLGRLRWWRLVLLYGVLGGVALALSFGPSPSRWDLFSMLSAVPGLGAFRAPARFALLVLLSTAVFAAFGARLIATHIRRGRLLVVALLPLMLSEWYLVSFPGGRPRPFQIPRIYRSAELATATALVSLPDYRGTPTWFLGADYLYFSTLHWRPIVNGFGRTEPKGHARIVSYMRAFPGPNNARLMRELGIQYIVFHAARHPDGGRDLLTQALASPEYQLVRRVGEDYLFKVRP